MQENNIKHRNKIIVVLIILILIVIICFLIKINYKNKNLGNNMSNKNIEEIEEYILNISSYEAKIDVTITSNKNTNKYLLKQIYKKYKMSIQTVLEPSNIAGVETKYEDGTLTISNSKLNLVTIYDNYNYLVENYLWLDSFVADYIYGKDNNESTIIKENDVVYMKTKTRNENNKYIYYKELIIDPKVGKPTKLLVQDANKNNLVYILYNEITVND